MNQDDGGMQAALGLAITTVYSRQRCSRRIVQSSELLLPMILLWHGLEWVWAGMLRGACVVGCFAQTSTYLVAYRNLVLHRFRMHSIRCAKMLRVVRVYTW